MLRQPAVADRFYPGSAPRLKSAVTALLPDTPAEPSEALGVITPHAGYIYSGAMAGRTLGSVEVPRIVIILGPNHHGRGAGAAISTSNWQMPGGVVRRASETAKALLETSQLFSDDELAHQFEHSIEVQVPFMQHLFPAAQLLPIVVPILVGFLLGVGDTLLADVQCQVENSARWSWCVCRAACSHSSNCVNDAASPAANTSTRPSGRLIA